MATENKKAIIFDIKRFAVHDGDGIRTTVFFKGCSLKCVWCHKPEGISFEPQLAFYPNKCIGCGKCAAECSCHSVENGIHIFDNAKCTACGRCSEVCLTDSLYLYGKEYTVDELMPILLQDRAFYEDGGGITLSGGECLCQAEFCEELLKRCKAEGLNTAVDTCGNVPFESFLKVLPFTDTFLYDIKAIDDDVHKKCTGVSNKLILENIIKLDNLGAKAEIRVPYVPELNSGQIEKIADFVNSLKNVKKVRVLPYHNYALGKYDALGIKNSMPDVIPGNEEIIKATALFKKGM